MIMNNIENKNQIEDMQDVMTENFLPETAVLEDEVERFINILCKNTPTSMLCTTKHKWWDELLPHF